MAAHPDSHRSSPVVNPIPEPDKAQRHDEDAGARTTGSRLFREEVLTTRRDAWLGSVHLAPPRAGWLMALLAGALLLAISLALALGSYTRKERAPGRVVPAHGFQTVVAPVAGTLVRALVEEGARVEAGTPLLEISADMESVGDGASVGQQVTSALTRQRDSLQRELEQHRSTVERQADDLHRSIASLEHALSIAADETSLRGHQAGRARATLESIRPLQQQQIMSQVQVRQYEDQVTEAEAAQATAQRQRLDLQRELDAARLSLANHPAEAGAERAGLERQLAEVEVELARSDIQRAVLLRAPGPGVVSNLRVLPGQALDARQRLLSIIPGAGGELRAELWVGSAAAARLAPGTPVQIRYDAFPHQTYGHRHGRVISVSGSTFAPEEIRASSGLDLPAPAYRVLVEPDDRPVGGDGERLRPGMTLQADLLLERRRLYQLLLPDPGPPAARAASLGDER